jgi:CheY-like chemotaxis protein
MTKHRVLIVDDYPDAAETACTLLSLLGHDCQFATCGKDALALAPRFDPDVAILDIGLPDVSGFDLKPADRGKLSLILELADQQPGPGPASASGHAPGQA